MSELISDHTIYIYMYDGVMMIITRVAEDAQKPDRIRQLCANHIYVQFCEIIALVSARHINKHARIV